MANVSKVDNLLSNIKKIQDSLIKLQQTHSSIDMLVAEKELLQLKLSILQLDENSTNFEPQKVIGKNALEERIVDFVGITNKATQSEICQHFVSASSRTIRRHLSRLLDAGVLRKVRAGREIAYSTKVLST